MKREYDFSKGRRGAVVPTPTGKTRITIRLDNDIIDWFRSQAEQQGGGNYQTMINNALRECINNREGVFEEVIRRVVRQEIQNTARIMEPVPWLQPTAVNEIPFDFDLKLEHFAATSESDIQYLH